MLSSETIREFENRLADLVHESASGEASEALRHRRFIASRLAMGVIVLACLPVYIAFRGAPTLLEYFAFACLIGPLFAALTLSRTGMLAVAHTISAMAFAGLIVCIAGSTGGIRSAAAIWLVAVPLEALLTSSKRSAIAATFVAGAATLLIAILDLGGFYPAMEVWPTDLAMPIFALIAIAHAGALVVAVSRREDESRSVMKARDAQDRTLLQVIDDLIVWHDANGHVAKASPAAMKLLRVPSNALEERGLLARIHIQDRPAYLKAISDAAVGSQPVTTQFRIHYGDALGGETGRVIWAEMRAYREGDFGPQPSPVVAVIRDISRQKRHEDDLELARLKAEKADDLKGRFLATVSHELRTPLNAIIGFSEILASESMSYLDADQRRAYAKIVHESGHHLLEVVTSLLDMSKIETGNFDFAPAPFDAGALLASCVELMRLKAGDVGIELHSEIARGLPELFGDQRACRQILINLISNAIKFTPKGGRVCVTLARDQDKLVFSIADNGVGVGEDDLSKLGNPFFQASSAYDRAHEGTGLGLSVVRGLVGLHSGALSIESSPGEGTTVNVELPIDCRLAPSAALNAPIPIRTLPRRTAVVAVAGVSVAVPLGEDPVEKAKREYKRSA
ncbi:MAG TPA: PAS domain-containing sensor histidine kinase [Saliniramus sp.]|nr:PAS domain-containing sensor histidine kinase [Saliniramus sp.]